MSKPELAKALIVAAEVMGSELSPVAAEVMVRDLSVYPHNKVAAAIKRCQREVTGRLSLAAVIARIDDGHPGPEEAWALCPRDEAQTVVWTDEMADAYGTVTDLIVAGDMIGARMAFKERYAEAVRTARDRKHPARWTVSLGHSAAGRNAPIQEAVARGRLTSEQAAACLVPDNVIEMPMLTSGERDRPPMSVAELLMFAKKKGES